ncbi:MAG: acylphosphatase [Thiohalobacterales bacterium]|nr:acylphosphatase [Thiohalobacterales bacterium]
MTCRRCLVTGRVQGVFFRASTREQAERLGITGYARNLPDGRVEVMACGSDEQVESLCDWLNAGGPPQARVTRCECETVEGGRYAGFAIR